MKTTSSSGRGLCAVASIAMAAVPLIASAEAAMPAEHYQGPVGYITGGVGKTEAKLFEQRIDEHPLAVEVLRKVGGHDQFTADATVRIADRSGRTVLDAKTDGPFMLVDLAPGRYSVEASLKGQAMRRSQVMVPSAGTTRTVFEFPAGPMHRSLLVSRAEGVGEGGLGG